MGLLRTTRSRAGRTEWWAGHCEEEGQGESEKPPRSGLVVILGRNKVRTFLEQEPFIGYLDRPAFHGYCMDLALVVLSLASWL